MGYDLDWKFSSKNNGMKIVCISKDISVFLEKKTNFVRCASFKKTSAMSYFIFCFHCAISIQ